MIRRTAARLRIDRRGTTIVEFALVAPVMLMMLLGLGDFAYQGYMRAILTGAVEKAGRDATIQGAGTSASLAALDQKVLSSLKVLNKAVQKDSSTRTSYYNFGAVGGPEAYDDSDGDGKYTAGTDCFYDVNGNKTWDSNPGGVDGQGGADDVTIYTIRVKYPHIFPVRLFLGRFADSYVYLTSSTVMKNQPYGPQNERTKVCPS